MKYFGIKLTDKYKHTNLVNNTELIINLSSQIVGIDNQEILRVSLNSSQQLVRFPNLFGEFLDFVHDFHL